MRTVLVNYATRPYAGYQRINTLTGRLSGFDECRSCGPSDIDAEFARQNAEILAAARGAGYWLWKPYVVARTLQRLDDGDLLFYADVATHFVSTIEPVVTEMERRNIDVLVLGEGFVEAQFTKRDALVLMNADAADYVQSPQRFASCFAMRNTPRSRRFAGEFLDYACDARVLTDLPNQCGLSDYPEFVAHRHDQSIFSLLTKKAGIEYVSSGLVVEGLADRRGQIINHTRAHYSPGQIAAHLLAIGVLSPQDMRDLSEAAE